VVRLLLELPLADQVERHIFSEDGAAAPDFVNAETLQTIRAHERRGRLDATRSRQALADLLDLPITRYPTLQLLERAWELRHNFSAYDATYVALAEALGSSFVTADTHLARAIRAHSAVEPVLLSEQ
jgi:predicted nucleic acid-binding protein